MTHVQQDSDVDFTRLKRRVEYIVGVANYTVGFLLTIGGLGLAAWWRMKYGGFGGFRAFYLHESWAFGTLELIAGVAMLRRWPTRWILEMLPLAVPVISYQYFILHFIYHRF
jgi:hypothetical protein